MTGDRDTQGSNEPTREANSSRPSTGEAAVRAWFDRLVGELGNHSDRLNAINVFPVADGDTGSNLYRTARVLQQSLREVPPERGGTADLGLLLAGPSRAALEHAQGNSGTLFAVAVSGFAEALAGCHNLTGELVARGLDVARVRAWSALSEPVDGTLLTALSEAASAARLRSRQAEPQEAGRTVLAEVLRAALGASAEAVSRTQHQLGSLAQAAVVDAGAVGMHLVWECLACSVTGNEVDESFYDSLPGYSVEAPDVTGGEEQSVGVEVMCTAVLSPLAAATLRAELDALGDSVLMSPLPREEAEQEGAEQEGAEDYLWRIHVHVAQAEQALAAVRSQGEPREVTVTSLGHDSSAR